MGIFDTIQEESTFSRGSGISYQYVVLGQLLHQVIQRRGVEHGIRPAGAVAQPVLIDVKNAADRKNVLIRDLAQTFFEFAYRRFANT